ncbi:hypothetical protein PR048_010921 [Dryococelus australis]|uniref:Uncharacterized protein n=1 Tax=Dryococelus australis TaxID=614101 RepID=A0ABQ9I417_9NEOP|nr:hypothetical protein PR048_010921 [Dryococelus australis]
MQLLGGFYRGSLVFPRPYIPALLRSPLSSLSSALKTSILRPTQKLRERALCPIGCYMLRSVSYWPSCQLARDHQAVIGEQHSAMSLASVRLGRGGVVDRLLASTKAIRVRFPAGSLLDFRKWEPRRTMPLVGGFSRGSPVSLTPSHRTLLHSLPAPPSSALNTSLLRAAQTLHTRGNTVFPCVQAGNMTKVSMCDRMWETGDPRGNPLTSDIVLGATLVRLGRDGEIFCPDRDSSPTGILSAAPSFAAPAGTDQGPRFPRIRPRDQTPSGPHTANQPFGWSAIAPNGRTAPPTNPKAPNCPPPTKANRVQSPAASLTDLRKRESFSRVSAVSPVPAFQRCSILTSFHPHRFSIPRLEVLVTGGDTAPPSLLLVACRVSPSGAGCTQTSPREAHFVQGRTLRGKTSLRIVHQGQTHLQQPARVTSSACTSSDVSNRHRAGKKQLLANARHWAISPLHKTVLFQMCRATLNCNEFSESLLVESCLAGMVYDHTTLCTEDSMRRRLNPLPASNVELLRARKTASSTELLRARKTASSTELPRARKTASSTELLRARKTASSTELLRARKTASSTELLRARKTASSTELLRARKTASSTELPRARKTASSTELLRARKTASSTELLRARKTASSTELLRARKTASSTELLRARKTASSTELLRARKTTDSRGFWARFKQMLPCCAVIQYCDRNHVPQWRVVDCCKVSCR